MSDPKKTDLFFLGISSATGMAVLCHQLNKYLSIKLSFYNNVMAINQDTILDNLPIFTSFEPIDNKLELNDPLDKDDFFDITLPSKNEITKFLIIQCKGEKSTLFPKINQLDFLFISNYSLEKFIPIIQKIPEVTLVFSLQSLHVGKKADYFQKLFYTN